MTKRTVPYRLMLLITIFLLQIFIFPLPKSGIISEALAIDGSENRAYAQAKFVPDEIIVKFKKGISEQRRNAILSKHNTTIKSINRRAGFIQLKVHDRVRSIRALVGSFRNNKEVEYAEPNYLVHTCLSPNDPDYPQLWGLNNIGQTGGLPDADIDAPEGWDIQTGSPSIITAVIDTGIDYDHEDLSYNMWINPGEIPGNGIDDDDNGYIDDVYGWDFVNGDSDPMDDNSHGTHCAGTIAAEGNNGIGVVGVNWTAMIMPLKFLNAEGSGTTTDAILAIQYAAQMGAKIMSNSWGGGGYSQALKDAITAAHEAGAVFVAAAGNNARNNDLIPHYPSSYDVPNIIAVAATDDNDELALFSNYGRNSVDLGAPGVSILSTVLNDDYGYKSGTSMATPHVAGSAGLLWAEYTGLTNDEVKAGILDAVDKIPALAGKTVTEGRLNAYSALIGVVPPVADAGPDQEVSDDDGNGVESVVLDGSGSYDPDGEIVSYEWKEGEALLGTEMTITYDFTVAGSPHTVTLRVTDDQGESAADEVIIIVNANQPPVADAGPDQSAYTGDTVTFDGSVSYDVDGEIVSYDWNFGDGSPNGTGVIASHVYSVADTYIVTLMVTDNGGLTDTDTCTVTISEQASDTMHVGDISMSLTDKKRGKNIFTYATAAITIMDAFDSPVEGATVSGHWSGLTQDTDSGTTGVDGTVFLNSNQVKNASGIFTFTVDDVAMDGWTYDPSANVETSDSITKE